MAFIETRVVDLSPESEARLNLVVDELVRSRFPEASIDRVSAVFEEDDGGDQYLQVTVVFDPKSGTLDTHRTLGLARHLRPKLAAERLEAFPVFRFLTRQDAASEAA